MTNPILEEIYKYRAEHAAKFGYDIHRMFADARERERLSGLPVVNRSEPHRRKPGVKRKPVLKRKKVLRAGS